MLGSYSQTIGPRAVAPLPFLLPSGPRNKEWRTNVSPTRSVRGLFTRSSRLAMTAVAVVIAVLSSLLAGVVLAVPAYAATAADLDHCGNGPLAAPVDCADADDWGNGNLNASSAHFFEGDSVPYRMVMTGLTAGNSYDLTFEWDTTKSGKHAFDYITSFNRTVTDADPCAGIDGCAGPADTELIPLDPNVAAAGVTQLAGELALYGGTITAVSAYTLSGTYADDSSTRITVTFEASDDTAVLAWGGHISTRLDWGMSNSAVAITGSPYHTRLVEFDGGGGSQDHQLMSSAVIFPGSITIIKDAAPNAVDDFNFSTTGGLLPETFILDDDLDGERSNTQTFSNITTFGEYTVTEAAADGWTLSFGPTPCTVTSPNGGSRSVDLATRTATINLEEGENVTCTFINTRQFGTLRVNKVLIPANDPGQFNLQIDGVTAGTGGNGATTGTMPVPTGPHTVGETAANADTNLNNYTTSIDCGGGVTAPNAGPLPVTVGNGQDVVCTITNTRRTGTITVIKDLSPSNDSGRFDLRIDGAAPNAGSLAVGDGGTTTAIELQPGAHTISEVGANGTDLADYSSAIACDDGTVIMPGTTVVVNLSSAQNIECTITNTRNPGTIRVIKDLLPSNDSGRFNLLIDGAAPNAGSLAVGDGGTTTAIALPPGSHTIGEAAAVGTDLSDYTSTIVCDNDPAVPGPGPLQVTLASGQDIVCTITNVRQPGTLTVNKVLSPADDSGRFNLQIDGVTAGSGANVGNGGTTGAISVAAGVHTVRETAGTNTSLSDYTASIACSDGTTLLGSGGPLNVTIMSGVDVVCTITNVSVCPPTSSTRTAASRDNDDDDDCYGQDPVDNDPGDPYGEDPVDTTVDDLYVQSPASPVDPGAGGAGDTTPLQPVDQVIAGNTEQPAPADPGPLGGFLPRTGAGIAGQAMLALLLMAAGLTLRLARRRRSPQA
jgi:hypothetical protein